MDSARGNAAQVPEINRLAVLRSISRRGSFTKMDVVREAHLSLPTVNDILLLPRRRRLRGALPATANHAGAGPLLSSSSTPARAMPPA